MCDEACQCKHSFQRSHRQVWQDARTTGPVFHVACILTLASTGLGHAEGSALRCFARHSGALRRGQQLRGGRTLMLLMLMSEPWLTTTSMMPASSCDVTFLQQYTRWQ